jgi:signal transduction histidine kinase
VTSESGLASRRAKPSDLVSLSERMGYLRLMRVVLAVTVLILGTLAPGIRSVGLAALAGMSGIYLLLDAAPPFTRALRRTNLLPVIGGTLLLDGIYLAWVMYATGGATSPLRFLLYLHIVAVTLLASYRTGLKITAWHSLLFFVVFYAQSAGLIEVKETILAALPGRGQHFQLVSMLTVAGMWAVALGTATLSAVSERELRGQKIDLEQLSATVAEIDQRASASDIPNILLDRLCEVFGFSRGAVLASPTSDDLSLMAYRGSTEAPNIPTGLDSIMEQAWNRRRTVLVGGFDPGNDPRLAALFPGGRNLVIVPLFLHQGYRLGILVLEQSGKDEQMKRWVVAMIEQFAAHAALAIHNGWLHDELEQKLQENRSLHSELVSHNFALEMKVEERTGELAQSLRDLQIVDDQRKKLLSRLVTAEEQERHRIAGDIHDGPVQEIMTAGMRLDMLRKGLTDPSQVGTVEAIATAVNESLDSLRSLLFDLRPEILDRQGLEPALYQYLANLDANWQVTLDNRLRREPPEDTRIVVYRIAQEALINVRKHAGAATVDILLDERDGGILTRVRDDGAGFSPPEMRVSSPGHLGLSSMRERAEMAGGWCTVRSHPGGGTTVEFWVPGRVQPANSSSYPGDQRQTSVTVA